MGSMGPGDRAAGSPSTGRAPAPQDRPRAHPRPPQGGTELRTLGTRLGGPGTGTGCGRHAEPKLRKRVQRDLSCSRSPGVTQRRWRHRGTWWPVHHCVSVRLCSEGRAGPSWAHRPMCLWGNATWLCDQEHPQVAAPLRAVSGAFPGSSSHLSCSVLIGCRAAGAPQRAAGAPDGSDGSQPAAPVGPGQRRGLAHPLLHRAGAGAAQGTVADLLLVRQPRGHSLRHRKVPGARGVPPPGPGALPFRVPPHPPAAKSCPRRRESGRSSERQHRELTSLLLVHTPRAGAQDVCVPGTQCSKAPRPLAPQVCPPRRAPGLTRRSDGDVQPRSMGPSS